MGSMFETMRSVMVASQLRPEGVSNVRVLEAMRRVPRENYVPEHLRAVAYTDRPLPLDGGKMLNPPVVTGRMLDAAAISAKDHVLIVASPEGYLAALAATLAATVTSVDADAALNDRIDGNFDDILIDGAVEIVPDTLIARLTRRGRLVTGIVERGVTRLALGRRGGDGFGLVSLMDADIAVLPEFVRAKSFVF